MPLKINLKKGQKVIINGAVLENLSAKTISFSLMNQASLMRENEILSPDEAVTPASRVYYAAQCLYLFPDKRDQILTDFKGLLDDYVEAAPSSTPIADSMRAHVNDGDFYQAIKSARELINHEHKVLNYEHISDAELRHDTSAGESDVK